MQNLQKIKQQKYLRRKIRVRAKISGTAECPRLSVYRSLKHIQAQLIDDVVGKTLIAVSDQEIKAGAKMTKTEVAQKVGENLAKKAAEKKIGTAVFDRNRFRYHGRVKALAEGARAGGLKI